MKISNKSIWQWISFSFISSLLLFTACKKEFDEPPMYVDPDITANTTIAQLKAMHTNGQVEAITTDVIVWGIVNADDRSGNYYKQISIQDSTAGITVRLDGTNLYTNYPVGRKIWIKMKGLYLGDYNGLVQIGGSKDTSGQFPNVAALASNLFDQYILKGSTGHTVTPTVITPGPVNNAYQSMLVQLDNIEVKAADTAKTWANATAQLSANIGLVNCSNASMIARTSGYANFAGINVPNGNGTIKAIYTVFGSTPQLVLRDTSDVQLNGTRCGGGPGPTPTGLMNISDVKALFTGTAVTLPAGKFVTGIVISDTVGGNIARRNMVMQQGNGLPGIAVRFATGVNNPFLLGDSIKIDVGGQELSEFQGALQLNNIPAANATLIAHGKTITPRSTTVADALANFEAWESTLVKFTGVNFTPTTALWKDSAMVNQSGSAIRHYGTYFSQFANNNVPTGTVNITGYLLQGGAALTKEISIRNLNDVQ